MISRLSVRHLLEIGAGMGPVLGLDTGTAIASLGVVSEGRIRAVLARPVMSHCSGLPGAVDEVLEAAGLALQDISVVAVAIGPGSFTGLRVGLSYAKGLSMARDLAIAGVSTLDAMALCAMRASLREEVSICPVIDARKGEVYAGLYRFGGDALERASGDLALPLTDLANRITGEVVFVGESKAEEARSLVEASGGRAAVVGGAELHLRGSFAAAIGAAKVVQGQADDAATLEPLYVRAPDASAKLLAVRSGEKTHGASRGRTHPAASGS